MRKTLNIIALLLLGIFLISFVSARELTCNLDKPVALWHFNEGNGSIANDSCYNLSANLFGGYSWINGEYGKSILFDGYSSYADAGTSLNQSFDDFSFSFWENGSGNGGYWEEFFRRGNYYTDEFIDVPLVFDGWNYRLHIGANIVGVDGEYPTSILDGRWHNVVGTLNGSSGVLTLYVDGVFVNNASSVAPFQLLSTEVPTTFGINYDNGWVLNGAMDEIAFFNRTLTPEEVSNMYRPRFNDNMNLILAVPEYPYVDVNTDYPIQVKLISNATELTDGVVEMTVTEGGTSTLVDLPYNATTGYYQSTVLFNSVGNYDFSIEANSMSHGQTNYAGTFYVRQPYYVTFQLFTNGNSTKYINNFAYITSELPNNLKKDATLETFLTPLTYAYMKKSPAFHSLYSNGEATLKLYEKGQQYVRLIDGVVDFNGLNYVAPNVTNSYGTYMYLGQFNFDGQNKTYQVLVTEKDIHPYRYLANWLLIIGIVLILVVSAVLLFYLPQYPYFSIVFGIGFTTMLIILRVIFWLWSWN